MPDVSRVTRDDYDVGKNAGGAQYPKRGKSFREMKPTTNPALVSDIFRSDDHTDFESNKALSAGRDLARPTKTGSLGKPAATYRRKGRRGRAR